MNLPTTINQLLDAKGRRLVTIDKNATVSEGCKVMADQWVGSLLALDSDGKIAGICTWHDIVEAVASKADIGALEICDVMTHEPTTSREDADLKAVTQEMLKKNIRHMPVVDGDGGLVGLITHIDALTQHLSNAEGLSDELHNYIVGSYPS